MTDRELLELAAKAAGYRVRWHADSFYGPTMEVMEDESGGPPWNPLTDDGDALRLAVKLGIDLEWRADARVAAYRHANADGYCFTAFESSRENRAENTRRAVVRAAAGIAAIKGDSA